MVIWRMGTVGIDSFLENYWQFSMKIPCCLELSAGNPWITGSRVAWPRPGFTARRGATQKKPGLSWPGMWEVRVIKCRGIMCIRSPIFHGALRQSRLGGDCRGALKYKARISRVNCTNIQFAGNILPGTDYVAECRDGVDPKGRWKVRCTTGRRVPR